MEYNDINLDYKAEALKELLAFTKIRSGKALAELALSYLGSPILAPATNSKVITNRAESKSGAGGGASAGSGAPGGGVASPPSALGVFAL